MKLFSSAALFSGALALASLPALHAFSAPGHRFVGALAEARLAQTDPATLAKLKHLLSPAGDFAFADAATIPDEIKGWDYLAQYNRPDFKVTDVTQLTDAKAKAIGANWPAALRQKLWEYFVANSGKDPVTHQTLHHEYHFTDIAIAPGADLHYKMGAVGTSANDLVHLIPYCCQILAGTAQPDARKITPEIAVVLLIHFIGDLHQPLHVGAEYFTVNGTSGAKADPNKIKDAHGDTGGNAVLVEDVPDASGHRTKVIAGVKSTELHAVWDADAPAAAFATWCTALKLPVTTQSSDIAPHLVATKPAKWKTPTVPAGGIAALAIQWANAILPVAQAAHERLTFGEFNLSPDGEKFSLKVTGVLDAQQKPEPAGTDDYLAWAGGQIQQQMLNGGWRLAWLLQKTAK